MWPAGVLDVHRGHVTHAFNPAMLRKRNTADIMGAGLSSLSPATMAWSADGQVLYKLLPQQAVAGKPADNGAVLHSNSAASVGQTSWQRVMLQANGNVPGVQHQPVFALDMSQSSPLRCMQNAQAPHARFSTHSVLPFCLEWQVLERDAALGWADGIALQARLSAGTADGVPQPLGLPSLRQSGAALLRTAVPSDEACTLQPGPDAGSVWLCRSSGIEQLNMPR